MVPRQSVVRGSRIRRAAGWRRGPVSGPLPSVPLRILVDEAVPLAEEAFGPFGEVVRAPGRAIGPSEVAAVDALVVRSVTRVDGALLEGSRVGFVGTATIGTDHVDTQWLARRGIAFASAPGCNARSVAEWVVAALLETEAIRSESLAGRTLGIVGLGHVGSTVERLAPAIGLRLLRCDPPRERREGTAGWVDLDRLLAESDAVTLHVPLVRGGDHPTRHLLSDRELARMAPGTVLLNSSRGSVVDGAALSRAIEAGAGPLAVLDVWEGEPEPDPGLVARVALGSPHVAGYSLDGKVEGTRMVAAALAGHLGRPFDPSTVALDAAPRRLRVEGEGRSAIRAAVAAAVPLRRDDRDLRRAVSFPPGERARAFDGLRRGYPERREFRSFAVDGSGLRPEDRRALSALGFRTDTRA